MPERNLSIRLSVVDGSKVKAELSEIGENGERSLKKIEAAATPASGGLKLLSSAANDAKFHLQAATDRLGILGSVLGKLGPAGLIAGASIAALGAGMTALVVPAARVGEEFNKLSQKTGVSVEALTALDYAAKLSDVSTEGLTKALQKLSVAMFDAKSGGGEGSAALKAMGIAATDAHGQVRPTEQVLLDLAGRFAAMPDGADKAALAVKLFGKSGMEMIPFLNQGREGITALTEEARRLGLVMSTDAAMASEALNDNMTRLSALFEGVQRQIGSAVIPILADFTEQVFLAQTGTNGFSNELQKITSNREATLSFLESVASGLAFIAESAILAKRVIAQPFDSLSVVGKDLETWLKTDKLKTMKAMGFDPKAIDAEIARLQKARDDYVKSANDRLVGINDNPGYVDRVKQFFDTQRRTVRVMGQKFVLDTEAQAKEVQAIYDKFLPTLPRKKPQSDLDLSGFGNKPKATKQEGKADALEDAFWADIERENAMLMRGEQTIAMAWEAQQEAMARSVREAREAFEREALSFDADELMEERTREMLRKLEDSQIDARKKFEELGSQFNTGIRNGMAILKMEDVYARHYQAADAVLEPMRKSILALNGAISTDKHKELTAVYNALCDITRKVADVSAATEGIGHSREMQQTRLSTLSAEVAAGIKTETDAHNERRAIAAQTLDSLRDHMSVLEGLAKKGYPAAIEALQKYKGTMIELQDAARDKTWLNGIQQGFKDFGGAYTDSYTKMRDATKSAMNSMTDALTQFVMTGKISFSNLANSIISDLVRIQIQRSITMPLANWMSGLFPGAAPAGSTGTNTVDGWYGTPVAHTGGVIGADALSTRLLPRFHSGGIAGNEVPAILQRGEGVFTKGQMAAIGAGMSRSGINVEVNVINNASGVGTRVERTQQPDGGLKLDLIVEQIEGRMARSIGIGAGLAPAMERRYGLNPAAGAMR